eukprot:gene28832-32020_t
MDSKLSDCGLVMLSWFGLNKKSSRTACPPMVGHCEDLPSPPPAILLSMTLSDLNLSFSALSPTNKVSLQGGSPVKSGVDCDAESLRLFGQSAGVGQQADVQDELILSVLYPPYSEVDLSPYSEMDFGFDFILEGSRVEALVTAEDDSSVLSELRPFSQKEGDNLNGLVALNGTMAFNGDNLEGTCVRSGVVGCTDHVSGPLGTKGHRHVSGRFPTSVLDTRVCSQRVLKEGGVLRSTASHNSTLVDEQRRHGAPSFMQKLFPVELQEKFKRKVPHTTKRLDPDHQKQTAVKTMARSAAKGHQRRCLAQ